MVCPVVGDPGLASVGVAAIGDCGLDVEMLEIKRAEEEKHGQIVLVTKTAEVIVTSAQTLPKKRPAASCFNGAILVPYR